MFLLWHVNIPVNGNVKGVVTVHAQKHDVRVTTVLYMDQLSVSAIGFIGYRNIGLSVHH